MSAVRSVKARVRRALVGADGAAVDALRREVAELRAALGESDDHQRRVHREVADDVARRLDAITVRLDALEAQRPT